MQSFDTLMIDSNRNSEILENGYWKKRLAAENGHNLCVSMLKMVCRFVALHFKWINKWRMIFDPQIFLLTGANAFCIHKIELPKPKQKRHYSNNICDVCVCVCVVFFSFFKHTSSTAKQTICLRIRIHNGLKQIRKQKK